MPINDLPTYAIVELLIRLSEINNQIGNYKDHNIHEDGVIVKTSTGFITFPRNLVMQQFEAPELITTEKLQLVANDFQAS